jgi:hypothetical protein
MRQALYVLLAIVVAVELLCLLGAGALVIDSVGIKVLARQVLDLERDLARVDGISPSCSSVFCFSRRAFSSDQ